MGSEFLAYGLLPEADTASNPLPSYMLSDNVSTLCHDHQPLALFHIPPTGATDLHMFLVLGHQHAICRNCGAIAEYDPTGLVWEKSAHREIKAKAIKFNYEVARRRKMAHK